MAIDNRDFQFISGKDFSNDDRYIDVTEDQTLLKEDHQTLGEIYADADPELINLGEYKTKYGNYGNYTKKIYQVGDFTLLPNDYNSSKLGVCASYKNELDSQVEIPALNVERFIFFVWAFGGYALFFRSNTEQMMLYTYDENAQDLNSFVNSFQQDGGYLNWATDVLGHPTDVFCRSACENENYIYFNGGLNTGRYIAWCRKEDFLLDPYDTTVWNRKDMNDSDIYDNGMGDAISSSSSRYNVLLSDTKIFLTNSNLTKICIYDFIEDTTKYYEIGESISENFIVCRDYTKNEFNIVANAKNSDNKYIFNENLDLIDYYQDSVYDTLYYTNVGDSGDIFKLLKDSRNGNSYGIIKYYQFNDEQINDLDIVNSYGLEFNDSNTDPEEMACFTWQQIIHGRLFYRSSTAPDVTWYRSIVLFDLVSYPDMFQIKGNGVIDSQKKWWLRDPDKI